MEEARSAAAPTEVVQTPPDVVEPVPAGYNEFDVSLAVPVVGDVEDADQGAAAASLLDAVSEAAHRQHVDKQVSNSVQDTHSDDRKDDRLTRIEGRLHKMEQMMDRIAVALEKITT